MSCFSCSQHYLQGLTKVSNSLAKSICEVKRYSVPSSTHQLTAFVILTSYEAYFLWQCSTVCHWCSSKNGSVWQAHSMYNAYFIQYSFSLYHHGLVRSCAFVLRWRYSFQVHIKWSTEHSRRDQIGTAEDWGSYLSFCTHKLIHNPIVHPVFTTSVYFFVFLFIYSDIRWFLSTQWRRIQQVQQ